MADASRKADTFQKIKLGGLVIKAGLGEQPPAVLLGLLVEAAKALSDPVRGESAAQRYRQAGDDAFGGRAR